MSSPESSSEDETLDFSSDKFNPFKALYTRNVKAPIPNAPTLDNLSKYKSLAAKLKSINKVSINLWYLKYKQETIINTLKKMSVKGWQLSSESTSEDESLDFSSDKFNPFKALYTRNVKVPIPNAPTLDNLSKYKSLVEKLKSGGTIQNAFPGRGRGRARQQELSLEENPGPSGVQEKVRQFKPEQGPVRGRGRGGGRNVFTRMKDTKSILWRLYQTISSEPPGKIRVMTRNAQGICGYLEGYCEAFDKHFNLAMVDVTEVFTRRNPKCVTKTAFFGAPEAFPNQANMADYIADDLAKLAINERRDRLPRPRNARVYLGPHGLRPLSALPRPGEISGTVPRPPPQPEHPAGLGRGVAQGRGRPLKELLAQWPPLPTVYFRNITDRTQVCERHLDKVLVRGEHVVCIQYLKSDVEVGTESSSSMEVEAKPETNP